VRQEGGVDLRYFSIIYDVIDQVRRSRPACSAPRCAKRSSAWRRCATCSVQSKFGAVAGCMVIEGVVKRNKPIRVLRDNVVVFEGELESLRRFKDVRR
jgi:translation initiation factor IF-2